MRSTVIQISKSIDERGEDTVAAIIKMNMKSGVFLKTFGKFINNHYPQHKEIAGKYLAIK